MRAGFVLLGILVGCEDEGPPPGTSVVDLDLDGFEDGEDCDDRNPNVFPGAEELCDDLDRDCDGDPFAGATDTSAWYLDGDTDGVGGDTVVEACEPPARHVAETGDCDDANPYTFPGAVDLPNDGVDSDCSGSDAVFLTCGRVFDGDVTFDGSDPDAQRAFCSRYTDVVGSVSISGEAEVGVFDCTCSIDGDLVIDDNPDLVEIEVPSAEVSGTVRIEDNPRLEQIVLNLGDADVVEVALVDLPELVIATIDEAARVGTLRVGSGVGDGQGLVILESPSDEVLLEDNDGLSGLAIQGPVAERIAVQRNSALVALRVSATPSLAGDLSIEENPLLSQLEGLWQTQGDCPAEALASIGGDLVIVDNPVLGPIDADWSCLASVDGAVRIENNGLLDWRFLSGLQTAGTNLTFDWGVADDRLGTATVLPELRSVAGTLRLVDVRTSVSALPVLETVGFDLALDGVRWTELGESAAQLTDIGGSLVLSEFAGPPTGLPGFVFPVLETVGGRLDVRVVSKFEAGQLASVGGDVSLVAIDSSAPFTFPATSVSGNLVVAGAELRALQLGVARVTGSVAFRDPSLAGAPTDPIPVLPLSDIGGDLDILGPIPDLGFLGQVSEVGGLVNVNAAQSLNGLGQLTRVGALRIVGTTSLTSLTGLGGLRQIDTSLTISSNLLLSDVTALFGVASVQDVAITSNPSLPTSAAQALVFAIAPSGSVTITGNGP